MKPDSISMARKEARKEALVDAMAAVLELIDSDEFYDMLPGDGEDDRICGWLSAEIRKRFKAI